MTTELGGRQDLTVQAPEAIHRDGSVPFEADQPLAGHRLTGAADPVDVQDLATKAYVDGLGAETGDLPEDLGETTVGVAAHWARADHVHAHGELGGDGLHSAATTSTAGFLSASDKTKLDGVAAGAAALTSATPAALGTAAVGTASTAARADHVHSHGDLGGGSLHSAATTSVAGFLAAADKSKLDSITGWSTFTPSITLTGGSGNTVPQYSTNTGRYAVVGNIVFVDVYLTGDGGNEGAGTGIFRVNLPVTAGANHPYALFPCGTAQNGSSTVYLLYGKIPGSNTTIDLNYLDSITSTAVFKGDLQNNTTRSVRLKFFYEI